MSRNRDEQGNAVVEFVFLGILLMVPLVYVLLTVFQVQSAAFGVTEAARQAGRAFAVSASTDQGWASASIAAQLAMADQGIRGSGPPEITCPAGCLTPGSTVTVTMRYRVPLLFLGAMFSQTTAPSIPVTAVHTQVVDTFQAAP